MMISKTSKNLQDENEMIDFSIIKKLLKILLILLIIFTILYFTCFGCFFIVTGPTQQSITLSSSGLANKTYPDSMGEYQPTEGGWYQHVDRDDRFLMYNKLGNIEYSTF